MQILPGFRVMVPQVIQVIQVIGRWEDEWLKVASFFGPPYNHKLPEAKPILMWDSMP